MQPDKVICAYCNKTAALMRGNDKTIVICSNCGIAIELETYKELFDNLVLLAPKEMD